MKTDSNTPSDLRLQFTEINPLGCADQSSVVAALKFEKDLLKQDNPRHDSYSRQQEEGSLANCKAKRPL